jgi:hypothetical protein
LGGDLIAKRWRPDVVPEILAVEYFFVNAE